MTSLFNAIQALEKMRDSDGTLVLNSDQSRYLLFLLWEVYESQPRDLKFAALDLMGVLDKDDKEKAV